MITVGEAVSRVRNLVKGVKQEAISISDRFLHSLIMKHAKFLMRRQDNLNRIMKFASAWQPLNFVELIEVDKAEAGCQCITTGCTIKRTKERLPKMIEGHWGPLIRSVSSLDQSEHMVPTFPTVWEHVSKQKNFKYNKTKYYWYFDGYLYFPNIDWDAVKMEGVFEGDISAYNCDLEDNCVSKQDMTINIPEFLFSEIEQMVMKDLSFIMQVPADPQHDNRNIIE